MAESTICTIISEVIDVAWVKLSPIHMPRPNEELLMDTAQEFYRIWSIPHCGGAVDVRHVKIKRPANTTSLYYNYKKFYSITLQGISDARYRFISIDVGGYGRQHDANTWRNSGFYKLLKKNKIRFPEPDELYKSRTICPYFLIGDGAYPLSENLLKPHPGKGLPWWKKLFNRRLSRGRVSIECAFGHMCQKFRIFYRPMEQTPEKATQITKFACLLNNIIIDLENPVNENNVNFYVEKSYNSGLQGDESECEEEAFTGNGENVRKKITEFFLENRSVI